MQPTIMDDPVPRRRRRTRPAFSVLVGLVVAVGCSGGGSERLSTVRVADDGTRHVIEIDVRGTEVCLSHTSSLGALGESCAEWTGDSSTVMFVSAGYDGTASGVVAVGLAPASVTTVELQYPGGSLEVVPRREPDWEVDVPSVWLLDESVEGQDITDRLLGVETAN